MSRRHTDALLACDAVNPHAVALAIARACVEIEERRGGWTTYDLTSDPAIRLLAAQLAYLVGVSDGSWNDNLAAALRACQNADAPNARLKTTFAPEELTVLTLRGAR